MSALGQLFTPLNYLRVEHSKKRLFDCWIPAGLAGLGLLVLAVLPVPVRVFEADGLIAIVTNLLQILTGFYIAALAAIATFPSRSMNQLMAGTPPTLWVGRGRLRKKEALTRRRFLSFLFGYLALLSLVIYFIGAGANLLLDNAKLLLGASWLGTLAKWSFLAMYLYGTSNLLVSTLLGLYYMSDRIHRSDPEIVEGAEPTDAEESDR